MSIVPQDLRTKWIENDCHKYSYNIKPITRTKVCLSTLTEIQMLTQGLNWYDLYRPNAVTAFSGEMDQNHRLGSAMVDGEEKSYRRGVTQAEYANFADHLKDAPGAHEVMVGSDVLTDYMNREDVRAAFNVPADVQAWEQCSYKLKYDPQVEASEWIY